ncbi:hypothetical protein H6G02_30085 [Leptolyngbya sp. FACHB-16]|nr:hypothetical protein [Leptolyngbya sp. FACHB-8]MBD2158692.1 hypothetical protein [Leptolyngbya sp. FACHB-16]
MVKRQQQEKDQEAIAQLVQKTADSYRGDGEALLGLLRILEKLHREIRDELFQETLPKTRHELYALLRDIEASGGWPYIGRMRLQALLTNLLEPDEPQHSSEP